MGTIPGNLPHYKPCIIQIRHKTSVQDTQCWQQCTILGILKTNNTGDNTQYWVYAIHTILGICYTHNTGDNTQYWVYSRHTILAITHNTILFV